MPLRSIENAARALQYFQRLQENLANNLANAPTDGFKRDLMYGQLIGNNASPVPMQMLDLTQGTLRETGGSFDLALEGQGFFVVGTAQGERLTRGGAFHLDPGGMLVDTQGDPVLGVDGPILVPGDGGESFEVLADGSVMVDGSTVGVLRIENVADQDQLEKGGLGRFVANGATEAVNAAETRVRQGAIEESNVDTINGMIDLITVQREFQANMSALQSLDGQLEKVANRLGQPI